MARRTEQIGFVVWLAIAVGINVLALLVINWIFDSVAIDGFGTYVGATIVVWLVNVAMQAFVRWTSGKNARSVS